MKKPFEHRPIRVTVADTRKEAKEVLAPGIVSPKERCGVRPFAGMMPPCVLCSGHPGDHEDGCGGYYSNLG